MSLSDELAAGVRKIFADVWTTRDGEKVPESDDLQLTNDAVKLSGTVLYADLTESTALVRRYKPYFAAEIYKTYLYCAAKIIRSLGGSITAYDGDRVMAVFIGGSKNSNAAKCGLKINWAVKNVIQPALTRQYPKTNLKVRQVVGVDTSDLFIARTGIRGSNDLVWVGRSANYAAKLSGWSADYPTYITENIYNNMSRDSRIGSNGKNMWTVMNSKIEGLTVYGSSWYWKP